MFQRIEWYGMVSLNVIVFVSDFDHGIKTSSISYASFPLGAFPPPFIMHAMHHAAIMSLSEVSPECF